MIGQDFGRTPFGTDLRRPPRPAGCTCPDDFLRAGISEFRCTVHSLTAFMRSAFEEAK